MFIAVSIFALTSLLDLPYNKIKVNYVTDIADITLRPRSSPRWVTLSVRPISHVPYSPDPLWANVASFTKPEVHNVLHRRHVRRGRRPRQATCTENFVKFGHVFFEVCKGTDRYRPTDSGNAHRIRYMNGPRDRQTDTLIAIFRTPTGAAN